MSDSESDKATCPKCGRKREPELAACPRCGLRFSLWRPNLTGPRTQLDARAQELWQAVEADWQDRSRHDEFAKYCLQSSLLPAAGRCYRDRLDRFPEDAIANQMQAEILAKATLSLMVQKQQRPPQPVTRSKWFGAIIVAAMALAIFAAFIWGPGRFRAPAPAAGPKIHLPFRH
jgi:hypothetical protein